MRRRLHQLEFALIFLVFAEAAAGAVPARAQTYPAPVEGDFTARGYRFESGETLPEVRLHYRTIGTPRKDPDGVVGNAVLILHGTGGSGRGFVTDGYAGRLFGKGQLLDADRYFIILPDNVGHGQSSKPSDGLRMKFPKYGYTDMVRLQHRLVTEGLGLSRLRLVMGTSMGAMHTWMWGYMYPSFADALTPLASNPVAIAGRNRIWRKALVDAIVTDRPGRTATTPRRRAAWRAPSAFCCWRRACRCSGRSSIRPRRWRTPTSRSRSRRARRRPMRTT